MNTAFSPFAGYRAEGGPPLQVAGTAGDSPPVLAEGSWPSILNPGNPLFWFMVLAGTTLGLVAVSGNVKLGRTKVSGSIGGA